MDRNAMGFQGRGGDLLILGLAGYGLAMAVLVVFAILTMLGIGGIRAVFSIASIATVAILLEFLRRSGKGWKTRIRLVSIAAGSVVLSVYLAGVFYDDSFDGRWYHQEGIIHLASGYDPVRDFLPEDTVANGVWSLREAKNPLTSAAFWVNHYPKASEILAASIHALVGSIELGKAFNFILQLSAFALVCGAAARCLPHWSAGAIALSGFATAVCPLAVNQSWTFMLDGQMYLLLVGLGVFLLLAIREDRWRWWFGAGATFVVLVNIKFTGLIDGLAFGGFAFANLALCRKWVQLRKFAGLALFILVFGIGFVGFNPYVRNLLAHGNPLYPLMGEGSIDIMATVSPKEFNEKDRFSKFLIANLANTAHLLPADGKSPPRKLPFQLSAIEIKDLSRPDARQAGFGPFFAPCLFASMLLYLVVFFYRVRRIQGPWNLSAILRVSNWIDWSILAILSTILVNPEFWWARYVPQMWLLPLLFGTSAVEAEWIRRKWVPRLAMVVYLLPVMLMIPWMIGENLRTSSQVEHDLRCLSAFPGGQVQLGQLIGDRSMFATHGIPLEPVAAHALLRGSFRDTLVHGGVISHSDIRLHAALQERPGSLRETLRSRYLRDRLLWFRRRA